MMPGILKTLANSKQLPPPIKLILGPVWHSECLTVTR